MDKVTLVLPDEEGVAYGREDKPHEDAGSAGVGQQEPQAMGQEEEPEAEGQTLNQRAGGQSGEFGITGINAGTKTEVTVCVMG